MKIWLLKDVDVDDDQNLPNSKTNNLFIMRTYLLQNIINIAKSVFVAVVYLNFPE